MVPAGWYADPAGRHEYRYWDGTYWTAGVADGGITATDPLEAPPRPVQQATFTPTPQPTAGFTPAQPAAQATPTPQPAAGFTPAQPSAGFTPAQPAGGFATTQPAAGFTPAQPSAGFSPVEPVEAAAAPPFPAGLGPMAPAGGPPAQQRRRRGWAVPGGIALLVVVGLITGLVIWAPWKSPPLLRPTGLTAGSLTTDSVTFHWSGPATGPLPDKYLILYNGEVIGSVPGTVTSYRTTGLAPDTPYQYRLVAERGGKRSARSSILTMRTAIPPISAARWQGSWTVAAKITRGSSTIHGPKHFTETWLASPQCATGPCPVRLSVSINGHSFKVTMARAGAVYRGKTTKNVFPCGQGANSFPVRSGLTIRVKLTKAQVENQAWTAAAWHGTVQVSSPYTASGNFYCPAAQQTIALTGGP
jgi:hypothetical protein